MSKKTILEDDWSDYDNLKKKRVDDRFFSCSESWEVDYLVRKIKKHHPEILEQRIRMAVSDCCDKNMGNNPREKFIGCVMDRLGVD